MSFQAHPGPVRADAIRDCFDGAVPGYVATCAPDGTPNITPLSQVQYVDEGHVALSYQFFNKTRRNVLANPRVQLLLIQPFTAAQYRLSLEYLRTETDGPLFQAMKAKLADIASHAGMSGVFRLLGSDIYRILAIEQLPGATSTPPPRPHPLAALRALTARLDACQDLDAMVNALLDGLRERLGLEHTMLLVRDPARDVLYTVGSRGYESSGVGSEIPVGQGVIGVCAREATPIRIAHATSEAAYARTIRDSAERGGMGGLLETEIPMPGLARSGSQMAAPVAAHGRVLGVLFAESEQERRFSYDDEDVLVLLGAHLGLAMEDLQACPETQEAAEAPGEPAEACAGEAGAPLVVRHYAENDSVFLDGEYLIKGVAGSILWALVQDVQDQGRCDFSNRELRLDPRIRLPDLSDNLEARLVLLARRLAERQACLQIQKTGRGRFRLAVSRPLKLESA